uniref:Spike protein n=1 Tax=Bird gammacoronavirus AnasCN24 TaxID=3237959 RepID=A0AB39AE98_9GAMC
MSAMFVLLMTVLFVPVNSLSGDGWVYYYPSAFRPSDGWHLQRGAYHIVGSAHTNVTQAVGCTYTHATHTPAIRDKVIDGVAMIPEPAVAWTGGTHGKQAAIHMVGCTMSNYTFYLWGPRIDSNTGRPSQDDGILFQVYDANYTLIYNKSMLFASYVAGFLKLKTFQCVSLFGSVYFNGDLLYQLGYDAVLQNVSFVHCNVTRGMFYYMEHFGSLVYFQNGTAVDLILCDDTPRGLLACQYGTGNYSDGLYPYSVDSNVNRSLVVYLTNTFVNNTIYGVLNNYTMRDVNSTLTPCHSTSTSWGCKPNEVPIHPLMSFTGEPAYYNLNFDVLSGYDFMPIQQTGSQYLGSWYYNCPFDLNNVNNGRCFNSFSISYAYLPVRDGCFDMVFKRGYTCCYMYNTHRRQCKGLFTTSQHVAQTTYDCGIAMLIKQQPGARYCTSKTPPTSVVQEKLNNTFVLDVCVNYNIYSRYGQGVVSNITDAPIDQPNFLADGGLVLLDNFGSVDTFIVNNANGRHYYKVRSCSDVNQQFVVSGGNIVGRLTSINESGSLFLDNQYYVSLINRTRHRRSVHSSTVTSCSYVSYGQYCIKPDGSVVQIKPGTFDGVVTPLLNATDYVLIPDSFNLTVTDEYIQTRMEQIQVNCIQYVCGTSVQCRQLFQQYGSVCDNILSIFNGLAQQDNAELISLYTATRPSDSHPLVFNDYNTGGFNISVLLPKRTSVQSRSVRSRSFIEDLLFTRIESVGLPTDAQYQNCTSGLLGWVNDLVCAQYYNGIMVLPPVITNEMQLLYTGSLVAAMTFGSFSAPGAIPFATQVQARINHLGITQTLILKNQEKIASSFNNALKYMQQNFEATSRALQQIQDVVNQQASLLTEVMSSLNKNFGAISSVIQDIYRQLDELSANSHVDRLITGRLSALSVLASSKQAEYLKVAQQRQLVRDKINECVRSQSNRNSFCGNGMHVLSIPQSAPNGIVFIHFTYTPQVYRNVTAVVGFCVRNTGSEYGLVPVNGRGIFIYVDNAYYITSRDIYMPRNITSGDVVVLTSCQANYITVNKTVVTTFVDDDFDFDDEIQKWWNKTDHFIPDLDMFNYTVPILDINDQIGLIQEAIKGLNDSYIDLERLSILNTYIKWPWYVWLAIAFATIIFIIVLVWIFFMTGCCGCFCGCFGLIPLMSKCRKKSSYYTTFDDDVVGEQIRPKKSV